MLVFLNVASVFRGLFVSREGFALKNGFKIVFDRTNEVNMIFDFANHFYRSLI